MSEPNEFNDWMWLVKTEKGDLFITVVGKWDQPAALKKVWEMLGHLKVYPIAMIPRKISSAPDEQHGTIWEDETELLGFRFLAGKKFWDLAGRTAEFEAERLLLEKQT